MKKRHAENLPILAQDRRRGAAASAYSDASAPRLALKL